MNDAPACSTGQTIGSADRLLVRDLLQLTLMRPLLVTGLALIAAAARASPPVECSQDSDCDPKCASSATDLAAPQKTVASFDSATCRVVRNDSLETLGCWCGESSGRTYVIYNHDGGCPLQGREGQCLYQADEFQPCVDGGNPDDTFCRPQCDVLLQRLNTDAMRQLSISVKGAACSNRYGTCDCAFQTAGTCYVNFNTPDERFDCSRDGKEAIRELGLGHGSCGCAAAPGLLALLALVALVRRSYRR